MAYMAALPAKGDFVNWSRHTAKGVGVQPHMVRRYCDFPKKAAEMRRLLKESTNG